MKSFITAFALLASISSFASNNPMTSIALQGNYQLLKASKADCTDKLNIEVSEKAIVFNWDDGLQTVLNSFKDKCGFRPLESEELCLEFKKNSFMEVSSGMKDIGYIKNSLKVSLKKNKLVIQRNVTAIPLGNIVSDKESEFECVYKKIE